MSVRSFSRSLAFFLAGLCLAVPASAQTNEADFTAQVADQFRAILPEGSVEVAAPLQLRLAGEGGAPPVAVSLGGLRAYCANATPAECDSTIVNYASATIDNFHHGEAPLAPEQMRVAVRATIECEFFGPDWAHSEGPLMRPFLPGLCLLLTGEFPTRRRGVQLDELRALGLEAGSAWALAARQTLAELPRPPALQGVGEDTAMISGFDYTTSLMIDEEGWRAAAANHDDLVVAVPQTNIVLVARLSNLGDLDDFRAVVQREYESSERAVTPTLYRWTSAGFVPLE